MFLIIDCEYMWRGGSNEYLQSLLWIKKDKKNRYTPVYPYFFYIHVGFKDMFV